VKITENTFVLSHNSNIFSSKVSSLFSKCDRDNFVIYDRKTYTIQNQNERSCKTALNSLHDTMSNELQQHYIPAAGLTVGADPLKTKTDAVFPMALFATTEFFATGFARPGAGAAESFRGNKQPFIA
jgi:hypothetical protein